MSNETIRTKLKDYLVTRGIKNRFIARQVGLSDTSISLFIANQRDLTTDKLELIWDIIKD